MALQCEVLCIGTGVAPLAAAQALMSTGVDVAVINPDWDFFQEDSELPLDPMIPFSDEIPLDFDRVARSLPKRILEELRPVFPGAVEFCSPSMLAGSHFSEKILETGFHDFKAPHVRGRSRLWVGSGKGWSQIEDLFVQAEDAGLNPVELEGIVAAKRFPGSSGKQDVDLPGISIPGLCDVDLMRFRRGLLDFVRERLGPERVICSAAQIQILKTGVHFSHGGKSHAFHPKRGLLIFWTPRLTTWILQHLKDGRKANLPLGVRSWEEWTVISREFLDPLYVGQYLDLVVWADAEGIPWFDRGPMNRLNVLRGGRVSHLKGTQTLSTSWASAESFSALDHLFQGYLGWEHFSLAGLRPRSILEWPQGEDGDKAGAWDFPKTTFSIGIVRRSDGALFDVVRNARIAAETC